MNIEDKIKKEGIEKVLIADDNLENLKAAKEYFSKLELNVDYVQSSKEAKEKIKESFYSNERYSFVISDMEMEKKDSGLEVCKYALQHCTVPLIATGRNYDASEDAAHGPNTKILPLWNKSIKGKKNNSEIWQGILENSLDYIQGDGKRFRDSLDRNFKYVNKPLDENNVKLAMQIYK